MNPLLCLRIGYMARYDGPDDISGGGAYVRKHGVGGEVFNFKPSRGLCYGYAMSRNSAGIRLGLLDRSRSWTVGDELDGVDVVFMARRPGHGQVVVGWYRGATVFHRQYRVRRGKIPGMEQPARQYLCVLDKGGATLLPEKARTFGVPSANTGVKGFPGQSNVWYPGRHSGRPNVQMFVSRLRRYIASTDGKNLPPDERCGTGNSKRPAKRSDAAHNAAVESAAVEAAWAHLEDKGFSVTSVETDNRGWDLEARKGSCVLRVEVKGHSGDTINFELTPNEFAKLKLHSADYRVCVVLRALDAPQLFDLAPSVANDQWTLQSRGKDGLCVRLAEQVAAIGVRVPA